MSFSVTTKELKRVDLVQVTGRVDSATAPQLEQALQKTIDAGRYNIVVDLAEAEYMSSAALRALISAQKQVKHGMRAGDVRIGARVTVTLFDQGDSQDAKTQTDATASELAAVKQLIEAKFPGAAVTNVARSPYFGLYEAQFDDRMIYTDAKVSYVFVGAIFDADSKQNLTDARLRQLNRVAWDQLPLDLAIKKVKGNGARKLAIFSDYI